jgi:GxxExxY protein
VSELLYKEEIFELVGLCMEIHRELGKGHDEVVYKDALVVELNRAGIPFSREKNYEITYKGVILPHYYYADFVVWQKILFEAKAVEKLSDSHLKQVLNYLPASKLRVGLLVNFGGDVLEWKRVIYKGEFVSGASNRRVNSWNSCLEPSCQFVEFVSHNCGRA